MFLFPNTIHTYIPTYLQTDIHTYIYIYIFRYGRWGQPSQHAPMTRQKVGTSKVRRWLSKVDTTHHTKAFHQAFSSAGLVYSRRRGRSTNFWSDSAGGTEKQAIHILIVSNSNIHFQWFPSWWPPLFAIWGSDSAAWRGRPQCLCGWAHVLNLEWEHWPGKAFRSRKRECFSNASRNWQDVMPVLGLFASRLRKSLPHFGRIWEGSAGLTWQTWSSDEDCCSSIYRPRHHSHRTCSASILFRNEFNSALL